MICVSLMVHLQRIDVAVLYRIVLEVVCFAQSFEIVLFICSRRFWSTQLEKYHTE